jgi:hypothetical protein
MNEINLNDKVETLWKESDEKAKANRKNMRVPGKGKVSKSKIKKGFVAICTFDDNKNVKFEKVKVEEGTYRLRSGEYHTMNEKEVFFYKGKPIVFQATKKLNPWNPLEGKNETYGQKMVMARMLGDSIKMKAKAAGLGAIIGIIIVVIIAINYFGGST